VRFSYIQSLADCYFTQESKDGHLFEWDFGDGTGSTLANPRHTYLTPGVFEVCLTAYGPSGYDVFCDEVEIEGIEKVIPSVGGNAGTITVFVYGGGFDEQSDVFLLKDGSVENQAIDVHFNMEDKTLTALFDLSGVQTGMWDVAVRNVSGELKLINGFVVVEGRGPKPFVTLASGGGTQVVNRWKTTIINVGNSGDSDAYGVHFWMAVPVTSQTEIRFLNLNVELPEAAIAGGYSDFMTDYLGEYIIVDSLFDDGLQYQLYGYYFPVIPAGYTFPVIARLKSAEFNQSFQIHTWVN
jgi:PKD repeat protein